MFMRSDVCCGWRLPGFFLSLIMKKTIGDGDQMGQLYSEGFRQCW